MDSIEYLDPENINGLNLFAYCGNNPVMYVNHSGNSPKWWQWLLFGIGVALVTVAAGMAILGTGGVAAFGMGALIGSLSIGAVGAVVGGIVGYVNDGVDGILDGALAGFGIGAIAGFVIGGIAGAISGTMPTNSGLSKTAIDNAVKTVMKDQNKLHHILQPKHNLSKVKNLSKLIRKTMIKGVIEPYKSVQSVYWAAQGTTVTYTIINNVIKISDMWMNK